MGIVVNADNLTFVVGHGKQAIVKCKMARSGRGGRGRQSQPGRNDPMTSAPRL